MKNSNIEWIGKIPEDWKVVKLKDVYNYSETGQHSKIPQTSKNGKYNFYLANREIRKIDTYCSKGKSLLLTIRTKYDIRIHRTDDSFDASVAIKILKNRTSNQYDLFTYYFLTSQPIREYVFTNFYRGAAQKDLDSYFYLLFTIPQPPLQEQQAIASFLDSKVPNLDKLIELYKKKIDKLKNYKNSLIYELTTGKKVIDSSGDIVDYVGEKVDSGVEWIGGIPKGWRVVRLKDVFKNITYGKTNKANKVINGKYPIYGPGLKNDGLMGYYNKYNYNETLLSIIKAFNPGKVFIRKGKYNVTIDSYLLKTKKNDNYEYYKYLLDQSFKYIPLDMSVKAPILSTDTLLTNKILRPPLFEQQKIAKKLDIIVTAIDKEIKLIEQKIEKLDQYKNSLIYEYTTGKKRLPQFENKD